MPYLNTKYHSDNGGGIIGKILRMGKYKYQYRY